MLLVLLLMLVSVRIDLSAQYVLGGGVVVLMQLMRKTGYATRFRLFFLILAGFLLLRYVWWRTFYTLGYNGLPDFIFMLLLYLAELYGVVIALLSFFVNAYPMTRKSVPLDTHPDRLPHVDVLIPTYNEPTDLLEVTLRAALDMRYPASHMKVYLLDDGGTLQKRTQASPEKAAEAQQRHEELQALAARHGGLYLTRDKNQHAKAGNVNEALAHCDGDLVLILDADHVPTVDFLEKTVGFFQQDEKLYLVQTPHFFINADPVEKNLNMFGRIPQENEMFYAVIQRGLDFWDSAYFCGSAAVLRRSHLDEVGGIGGVSITEDAETAMKLHACGYHSAYLNEPLISGLQPETFSSFIVQRLRWAQGMVQLFMLKNVFGTKGLSVAQKLCYFSNTFYWFFSYARVMLLLSPMAYLIFGLRFYNASIAEFFGYGLPAMLGTILTADQMFGRYRWTLISELYEMLQSLFSLQAIFMVIRNPRAPSFNVTPKGEQMEEDAISQLASPFYVVYVLVVLTMIVGIWKYFHAVDHRDVIVSAICWNLLNLLILNACIGVLYERRQRRATPRVPTNILGSVFRRDAPAVVTQLVSADQPVMTVGGGATLSCHILDISSQGAQLSFDAALEPEIHARLNCIRVFNHALGHESELPIVIRNSFLSPDEKSLLVGVQFTDRSVAGLSEAVALSSGDSQRWTEYRERRNQKRGIIKSIILLFQLGALHAGGQYMLFFKGLYRFLRRVLLEPILSLPVVKTFPHKIKKFYVYLIS
ncbi:cellulose synthase (UDP-forming) [Herbaspirillum sp. Sphag1AN]|uniref:UDP-forming cellulose synthase catalytic subunit n=1 Tax=unclassified Herbaspirillum TaxID=2624150 RepID=UPI00184B222A|nr:cellulose synthase (UDP-forming) [Herbaspirillum sp. Sphag1AN]MBB3246488.1 cellulose synthase (UDP-forming) [Herbaspirillum sp. Sphag64]